MSKLIEIRYIYSKIYSYSTLYTNYDHENFNFQ